MSLPNCHSQVTSKDFHFPEDFHSKGKSFSQFSALVDELCFLHIMVPVLCQDEWLRSPMAALSHKESEEQVWSGSSSRQTNDSLRLVLDWAVSSQNPTAQ
jgi:hypothetical protein